MKKKNDTPEQKQLNDERWQALGWVEEWIEPAMTLLGLAWLVLVVIDLVKGLAGFLLLLNYAIWGVFIIDYLVRFVLAPDKRTYLANNWLTALSLAVPALRVFRVFRALRVLRVSRVTRTARLLKTVASMNRVLRMLSGIMSRRGLGYVLLLTLLFTFLGAAGMYSFERNASSWQGFRDYGSSFWWTAMIMTTMGSRYWPETPEGRLLCLLLATYAFAVFGYVTASIAAFFIGLDREPPDNDKDRTIASLRSEVDELRRRIDASGKGS